MYESFFGLKRRPFAATPDPQCFLASESIQAALDETVVCIEQGQGIAIVSAPAGTGKTLLCERLRSELGSPFESVLLRHASFLTRRALLQTILCELSHAYRQQDEQELRLELIPAIRALRPQREALVLICDEAHQLSEDLLEELRILSDLAEQGRPLVRLVLVGQLGLEETLASPGLEALNQRIRAHVCLETLDRAGTLDYIDYRLTWAGGRTEEIFSPEALDLVSRAADGVPRCINQLCDHALLLAYVAEQQPVPPAIIREALHDLRQLPLHWNETSTFEPARQRSVSTENADADIAAHTSEAANIEFSFEDRLARDRHSSVESFEIGADLPNSMPKSQPISTSVPQLEVSRAHEANGEDDIQNEVVHAESTLSSQKTTACGRDSVCEFGYEANDEVFTEEIDEECLDEMAAIEPAVHDPLAAITILATRFSVQRGFTEELVLDRYAAIDAGLEPVESSVVTEAAFTASTAVAPTPIASEFAITVETIHDQAVAQSFVSTQQRSREETTDDIAASQHAMTIEVGAIRDSMDEVQTTVIESVMAEANAIEANLSKPDIDFAAACARLHERLPQVADETAWDSSHLRYGLVAEYSEDTTRERESRERDDHESAASTTDRLEELLGAEVCELVQELQQTMGLPSRPRSPVEKLRKLLATERVEHSTTSTASREEASTETAIAVCERPATAATASVELNLSASEAAPETSSRPYRNLFSILRRKQQGLI